MTKTRASRRKEPGRTAPEAVPEQAAEAGVPWWRDPWVLGAALLAAASFAVWPREFSNIDEYNGRAIATDFAGRTWASIVADLGNGRFRPLYWVLEGSVSALTGSTATFLAVGRAAFLALQVWLFAGAARRLGAGRAVSVLLALSLAWSVPALEVWILGGPAEAFGNPLALACVFLVLRATTPRQVLVAAAAGLAAALTKESYGLTAAAALGAFGLAELLRRRIGAAFWLAAAGAAVQFVPAAIAALGPRQMSSSYLAYVVGSVSGSPAVVLQTALAQNSLGIVVGAVGLALVLRRLFRTPVREWPLADVVVLSVLAAEVAALFALGLVMSRYHLPVGTALYLVAARGARELAWPARRGLAAAAIPVTLAAFVLAGGARAAINARSATMGRRAMGRLRDQIADSLKQYGAIRIYWLPPDVEQPLGSIAHLRLDGRIPSGGEIELSPCTRIHPAEAPHLEPLFAAYSTPVSRPAPVLVSLRCPRVPRDGVTFDRSCDLTLPSLVSAKLAFSCSNMADFARFVSLAAQ
jgi:hypothetical protein